MTITSANFNITGVNGLPYLLPQDIEALDLALKYLEGSQTAVTILNALVNMVKNPEYPSTPFTIQIIHTGKDIYDTFTNTLRWDPDAANIIYSGDSAIGVDSAALGFIHEAAHATDPNPGDINQKSTNPKIFPNASEEYAVGMEDKVAKELKEVVRLNYQGNEDIDLNPTDHTIQNSNSWQEQILNGNVTITGGSFTPGLTYQQGVPYNYAGNPATVQNNAITVNNATLNIAANTTRVSIIGSNNKLTIGPGSSININGQSTVTCGGNTATYSGKDIVSCDANGNLHDTITGSISGSVDNILPSSDFVFTSGSVVNTIDDSELKGEGIVSVSGTQLTGGSYSGANQWTDANGTAYQFNPLFLGSDIGTLTISQGLLNANSGDKIVIQNFNLSQAQSANGYLGIHFTEQTAIQTGNKTLTVAQVYELANGGPTALDPPPGAYTFTAYVSALSNTPQQVTINMSQGDPSGFAIDTGNGLQAFSGGSVILTVAPGEDSVTFGLVNTSAVAQPEAVKLTATITDPVSGTAVTSTAAEIDYTASPTIDNTGTTSPDHVITGGLTPVNFGTADNPVYHYDSLGNIINDGTPDPTRNDTLYGSTGNDQITTDNATNYVKAAQGGNDTIIAGSGTNYISASNGNNSITGGGGIDSITAGNGNNLIQSKNSQDVILVGNGTNQIYANTQTTLANAITQAESATATGKQGDLISVGSGNDTIVGSNGNDAIFLGSSSLTLVLGAGEDIVYGGQAASSASLNWTESNAVTTPGATVNQFQNVSVVSTGGYTPSAVLQFLENATGSNEYNSGPDGNPVGAGNETIFGGTGNYFIEASNGNNYIDAGSGNSDVFGGGGNDTIFSSGNSDIVGGGGNDYIEAEAGNNGIEGGAGNNTIITGTGNNLIYAGVRDYSMSSGTDITADLNAGNNYVQAGSGQNTLYGSAGNDTLRSVPLASRSPCLFSMGFRVPTR